MHNKDRLIYGVCNFLIYMSIAIVYTQMIPFMKHIGYGSMQQGTLLAVSAFVAMTGQLFFGYLCDRYQRMRIFFMIAYLGYLFSAVAMMRNEQAVFFYHLLTIGLSGGLVRVLMGMNETWMLEADRAHYGVLRAAGALGLSIGSLLIGYLITISTYQFLSYVLLMMAGICLILLWFCKDIKKEQSSFDKEDLKEMIKDHRYQLLIIILFLIYMIGTIDQYAVVEKLLSIGGDTKDVGWKWGIQSFSEIPVFFVGNWLIKKIQAKRLLQFAIFMYGIKFFLYAFFQTPLFLVFSALLQVATLPLIMLSSKFLIQAVTDGQVANSAQMFAMAIFMGGSAFVTPLLTSFLMLAFGYDLTLYAASVFCVLPFILTFCLKIPKDA